MTKWEFPEATPVRSISPEQDADWYAAKGLLLGEDRPDGNRCTGCTAASCEPCRQVSLPQEPGVAAPEAGGAGATPSAPAPGYRRAS